MDEPRNVVFPPEQGWLTPKRVDYLNRLFQMIFFGIGIPYLLIRLLTDPLGTLKAAAPLTA